MSTIRQTRKETSVLDSVSRTLGLLFYRSWSLYSYAACSLGDIVLLHILCGICVCTGGEHEWENYCCNCALEHLLCIEILCCHNFNFFIVYTLLLSLSFVSFDNAKIWRFSADSKKNLEFFSNLCGQTNDLWTNRRNRSESCPKFFLFWRIWLKYRRGLALMIGGTTKI